MAPRQGSFQLVQTVDNGGKLVRFWKGEKKKNPKANKSRAWAGLVESAIINNRNSRSWWCGFIYLPPMRIVPAWIFRTRLSLLSVTVHQLPSNEQFYHRSY